MSQGTLYLCSISMAKENCKPRFTCKEFSFIAFQYLEKKDIKSGVAVTTSRYPFALRLTQQGVQFASLLRDVFCKHGLTALLDTDEGLILASVKESKKLQPANADGPLPKPTLLLLSVPPEQVEAQAEFLQVEMFNFHAQLKEPFVRARRQEFLSSDSSSLFQQSEFLFLAECAVRSVLLDAADIQRFTNTNKSLSPPPHEHEILLNVCRRLELCESPGLCVLRSSHSLQIERDLARKLVLQSVLLPNSKADLLRNYFGEDIAYYFAWLAHFTRSLLVLGVGFVLFQVITLASRDPEEPPVTVDRNPWVPIYALLVIVWGFLFCKTWRRNSDDLAWRWNTLQMSERIFLNPHFHGEWRLNSITGLKEKYYPAWKRRVRVAFSVLVTGSMLCVAFVFMIASLNLQGLIQATTGGKDVNPFHIPLLGQFSETGGIFDANGTGWLSYLPPMLHSTVIFVLNQVVYRRIAERLTRQENHRSQVAHDRSLILKRYFFDAFDSYIALFYLAFYELDVVKLRQSLLGLYLSDNARRILLEAVIPFLMSRTRYGTEVLVQKRKEGHHQHTARVLREFQEVLAEEYEQFDDYLEMTVEHGYITMFAGACPATGLLSVLTNWVEMKADLVKLLLISQRPAPRRAQNIGVWESILKAQTWMAVLTNVLLFGVSSAQMRIWCPWLFQRVWLHAAPIVGDHTHQGMQLEQELTDGYGRYALSILFLLEHGLLLLGLFLDWSVEKRSLWLRQSLQKNDFQKLKRDCKDGNIRLEATPVGDALLTAGDADGKQKVD